MGFRVCGLGFGAWDFRDSRIVLWVWGLRIRVSALTLGHAWAGLRILGWQVQGSRFRLWG